MQGIPEQQNHGQQAKAQCRNQSTSNSPVAHIIYLDNGDNTITEAIDTNWDEEVSNCKSLEDVKSLLKKIALNYECGNLTEERVYELYNSLDNKLGEIDTPIHYVADLFDEIESELDESLTEDNDSEKYIKLDLQEPDYNYFTIGGKEVPYRSHEEAKEHLDDFKFSDYEKELYEFLKSNNMYNEIYVQPDNTLCIKVEYGDWKHDHTYLDKLVHNFFFNKGLIVESEKEVTEESDSDCFSADHFYRIVDVVFSMSLKPVNEDINDADEVLNFKRDVKLADNVDDIQDLIYSLSDGVAEDNCQTAFYENEDKDLQTLKDAVISALDIYLEDNEWLGESLNDVLEYDDKNIDKWASQFDVASPQECADLLDKPVRDGELIYRPQCGDPDEIAESSDNKLFDKLIDEYKVQYTPDTHDTIYDEIAVKYSKDTANSVVTALEADYKSYFDESLKEDISNKYFALMSFESGSEGPESDSFDILAVTKASSKEDAQKYFDNQKLYGDYVNEIDEKAFNEFNESKGE